MSINVCSNKYSQNSCILYANFCGVHQASFLSIQYLLCPLTVTQIKHLTVYGPSAQQT